MKTDIDPDITALSSRPPSRSQRALEGESERESWL